MRRLALCVLATLALAAGAASAAPDPVVHNYAAPDSPIAASAVVPPGYSTVYISGMTAGISDPSAPRGSIASYGSTSVQTESALRRIQAALQAQGLDMGDVVSMRVYLVGDPAKGGQMDFAGLTSAFARHFGTPEQPNRPVRTTVQVSGLVLPGLLVEIETTAAKPPR
ncbi:MAG: RidA family protein [Caulobacteraceae bacterium]|nr:RidA family protein [Caulobacteraceae bacterium]